MPLTLLAAADLHLGRRPGRLPQALTRHTSARELGPAAAWERLVELALAENAHALLLAGDVVEAEHDFFEAYRELHRGLARLLDAGVRVVAVSGNHDTRVLPRLADELEGFTLLGRDGAWERTVVQGGGEEATIHGWSFSGDAVRASPLGGHRFERRRGPNVGLLHCDRDASGSSYAPVASAELDAAGLDAWLLGHIHSPDALALPRPTGYLGSLTGLDPGEPGPRGTWILGIEDGALRTLDRHPLGPLRWHPLALDVGELAEPEEVQSRLVDALERLDATLREEASPPRAVGVRLTLTGRTRFRDELDALLRREEMDDVPAGDGSIHYFVETWRVDTLPEVALDELARRPDPAGLLAHRLLLLDRPADDPERARLVADAHSRLARVSGDAAWRGLDAGAPDDAEVAIWLRRAGRAALDRLLAQREEG